MPDVGWGTLPIIPSFDGFGAKLRAGTAKELLLAGRTGGEKFGEEAGHTAGRRFGRTFTTAAKASLVGAAGLAVAAVRGGIDAIGVASDLNETINKSNVIFGQNAKAMQRWSDTAAEAFGLSKEEALASASQFGDMFSQLGFTNDRAAKMSRTIVQMAADFGSFNNLETGDVLERISAGFRGEYDSLQLLIPNISAARVQKEALAMTGKKNAESLTAQEKATATLAIMQHDGARAAGDFARTSDELANKQKILRARFEDVEAKLGTGLLPIATDVVSFLNDKGIPAFEDFSDWFVKKGIPFINDFVDDMRPLAKEVLPAAGDAVGIIADGLKTAAPLAKSMVSAFNDMPDWAKTAVVGGGAGLFALSKLRGKRGGGSRGGLGGGGGVGGLFSKASPVPVFVTNPGFGGADVSGGGGKHRGGKPGILGGGTLGLLGTLGFGFATAGGLQKDVYSPEDRGRTVVGEIPDDAARKLGLINDAWSKVRTATDDAKRSTQIYDATLDGLPNDASVLFNTPGLGASTSRVEKYGSLLDGLDGRAIETYITSTQTNSVDPWGDPRFGGGRAAGGSVDPSRYYLVGEHGPEWFRPSSPGSIDPNAQGGRRGGVHVSIGTVRAHDYRDFMNQMQDRARATAGGGVVF